MAGGAQVDRIAAEYGVHFVNHTKRAEGRHQSKARKTCQTLLRKYGQEHLRLVLGLINSPSNRGNWSAPCVTAVSWLVLNKPEWVARGDFLDLFDGVDLKALLDRAKKLNPSAPTVTLSVLLSWEVDQLIAEKMRKEAA